VSNNKWWENDMLISLGFMIFSWVHQMVLVEITQNDQFVVTSSQPQWTFPNVSPLPSHKGIPIHMNALNFTKTQHSNLHKFQIRTK
jgi:hypothetical protein